MVPTIRARAVVQACTGITQIDGSPCTIQPVDKGKSLRWLGVYFDRKLSFKNHARILSAKAMQVANGLRSLGNTARGAPAHLLRQAVIACILPVQYYALEAWWLSKNRVRNGQSILNGVGAL